MSTAAVTCIFLCQTPLGEGSNILYCMCSSHHNHRDPTGFFYIFTLKTNRVTTTSSCHLFFFYLIFIYFFFPIPTSQLHWCRLFKSTGVALKRVSSLFSLPSLPSASTQRMLSIFNAPRLREKTPQTRRRGVIMMNSFKQMRGFTLLKISALLSPKKEKKRTHRAGGMVQNTIFGKVHDTLHTNICSFQIDGKTIV